MITITRNLARQLRAICRRAGIKPSGAQRPQILLEAGPHGLVIQVASESVVVQHRQASPSDPERLIVPLQILKQCEGKSDDPVTLETDGSGRISFGWIDRDVPHRETVDQGDPTALSEVLALPTEATPNPPELLQAMAESAATADQTSTRYALTHIQLSGQHGRIAATDGRQALTQTGYSFPWQDNLLVPALDVFQSRELPQGEPVAVAKTDSWVVLGIGNWTIWLAIDKEGRFPRIEDAMPRAKVASSRLQLAAKDRKYLCEVLPRLPAHDEVNRPVTLDLNGHVALRCRSESSDRPTELLLTGSALDGDPVCINTDREYLRRAAQLGFEEVLLFGASAPVLCTDGRRQYCWALLEPSAAIKSTSDSIRVEPSAEPVVKRRLPAVAAVAATSVARTKQRRTGRPDPQTADVIAQAVSLRQVLRDAARNVNTLIRSLKQQRKQDRAVRATLASLRQLQVAS